MTVDLRTCQPGQKVRLRNGQIAEYYVYNLEFTTYPHFIRSLETDDIRNHTDAGLLFKSEQDDEDVVEILPLTFTPEAVAPFRADIAASPSTPEAEELIRVYESAFGSTAPGCCPNALASVLDRIAESDPSSRDLHRLAAALRGDPTPAG